MNYYIEKHDTEIILDALSLLRKDIESQPSKYVYSVEDVLYTYARLMEKDDD
jgi:hypothetical protein